mmetsp:Transcript_6151/g.18589  ORF Transcript_6151/g.18589 Transcript_6151/m.18589 type:complete len:105 (+) Transcript_6151:1600-1914(+)
MSHTYRMLAGSLRPRRWVLTLATNQPRKQHLGRQTVWPQEPSSSAATAAKAEQVARPNVAPIAVHTQYLSSHLVTQLVPFSLALPQAAGTVHQQLAFAWSAFCR